MKIEDLERIIKERKEREESISKETSELRLKIERTIETGKLKVAHETLSRYDISDKLDKLSEDEIVDRLSEASDAEKLITLRYLHDQKLVHGGCAWFGEFKSPTLSGCKKCIKTEGNIMRLGLEKYLKYRGDRVYEFDYDKVREIENNYLRKKFNLGDLEEKLGGLKKEREEIKKSINNMKTKLYRYEVLLRAGIEDYERFEEENPLAYSKVLELENAGCWTAIYHIKTDKSKGVTAILYKAAHYRDQRNDDCRVLKYHLAILANDKHDRWIDFTLKDPRDYDRYAITKTRIGSIEKDMVEVVFMQFKKQQDFERLTGIESYEYSAKIERVYFD